MPPISRLRLRHPIEPALTQPHIARVEQRPHLQQNPVPVLQRGNNRPRIAAREKMPVQRLQRPRQVAAKKRLRRLEEISLRNVRRQLRHERFLDRLPLARVRRELVRLLDQEPRVRTDFREQQLQRPFSKIHAELPRLRQHHTRERLRRAVAITADQQKIRRLLAPLRKCPPPVNRRRRDEHRHLLWINLLQQFLQILHELQRALRPTRDRVREEVHILEPHQPLPAKHRHRLHTLAEPVDRRLHLADVAREPAQHFARKLVRHLGGEFLEARLSRAVDEEVIRSAHEDKRFGGGHAPHDATVRHMNKN